MKCENCKNEHIGNYGSGRFCSRKCARSFSTKSKREVINYKVSLTLRGRPLGAASGWATPGEARDRAISNSIQTRRKKMQERIDSSPTNELPKRLRLAKLLSECHHKCEKCGQGELWNGEKLTLQEDHADGNSQNNLRKNLRMLCPNCHTQTETWGTRNMTHDEKIHHSEATKIGILKHHTFAPTPV